MGATGPLKDPQRDSVYYMETRAFGAKFFHRVSCRDLRKAFRRLCRQSKLVEIPLRVYRLKKGYLGMYHYANGPVISLDASRGANYMTLCHEFAHYYTHHYFPRSKDHGPTFMGVYARALESLHVLPRVAMAAVARQYKVKIKPLV